MYIPCLGNSEDYVFYFNLVLSYIDNLLFENTHSKNFIMGDFNFAVEQKYHGYQLFSELCQFDNIFCCDELVLNKELNYTYFHESLGHRSWLDHIFISSNLKPFMKLCHV